MKAERSASFMSDVRILKDVCDRRANRIAYAECRAPAVLNR